MTLTNENLMDLEAPFAIGDHKLRWDGNIYLTELPLIERLTDVDPNWEFRITSTIVTDYNLTRPDCVITSAELTICGITRAGVGSARADVSKKDKQGNLLTTPIIHALDEKELKGAATDALKRCARQFGVGSYILRTANANIRNLDDFVRWYKREFDAPEASELDDVVWTRAPEAFIDWVDEQWGKEVKSMSHLYNCIAKALGLPGVSGQRAKLIAAIQEGYTGTKDEAAAAVRGYEVKNEN